MLWDNESRCKRSCTGAVVRMKEAFMGIRLCYARHCVPSTYWGCNFWFSVLSPLKDLQERTPAMFARLLYTTHRCAGTRSCVLRNLLAQNAVSLVHGSIYQDTFSMRWSMIMRSVRIAYVQCAHHSTCSQVQTHTRPYQKMSNVRKCGCMKFC